MGIKGLISNRDIETAYHWHWLGHKNSGLGRLELIVKSIVGFANFFYILFIILVAFFGGISDIFALKSQGP